MPDNIDRALRADPIPCLRNCLQEFFNGVGRDFDQDSIAIRCVEQSCPSVIEVECPLRAFLLY